MRDYARILTFDQMSPTIAWLNRSLRFYLPTRDLVLRNPLDYNSAILFLGFQTIELVLKASLVLWDRSSDPCIFRHNTEKLFKAYQNKVPKDLQFVSDLHPAFINADRFQSLPRYPSRKKFFVPHFSDYLDHLDHTYCGLAAAVPRTFWQSELEMVLNGSEPNKLKVFRTRNRAIRRLRQQLGIKIGFNPRPSRVN